MAIRILLADDSLTIQKVVELTFSDADTRLMAVGSGDRAVQALDDFQPDIVLADVVMPGLTGYDVCDAVKKRPGGEFVPVVLLTGTFEPFDRTRAERVGSDAIVTKPFDSHALQGLVRELVSKARAARADAEAAAAEVPPVPSAERPTIVLSVADLEETVGPPTAPIVDTGRTQSFAALDYTAPAAAPFEEAAAAAPQGDSLYSTMAMRIPSAGELRLAAEQEGLLPTPPSPFESEAPSAEPELAASPFGEEVETSPMSRPGPDLPYAPPSPLEPPPPPPPPAFYEPQPAFTVTEPPPPPAFYEPEPPVVEEGLASAGETESTAGPELLSLPTESAPAESPSATAFELALEEGPDTEPVAPLAGAADVPESALPFVGAEAVAVPDEPLADTAFVLEPEPEPETFAAEDASEPGPAEGPAGVEESVPPVLSEEAVEPFPEMDEPAPAVEGEATPWDDGPVVEIPPPPPELSAPPESDAPEPITRDLEQDLAAFEASGRVLRRPEIWERHAALIGEQVPTDIDVEPGVVEEPVTEARVEPSSSELEELAAASRLEDLSRLIPPTSVAMVRPDGAPDASAQPPSEETAAAEPAPAPAGYALTAADVDRIARRVVELLSEKAVRDIAWEVVPEYAERLVRERIAEVEAAG